MTDQHTTTPDREIRTTRTFHAPIERVWEVWTNPDHIALWWGPAGFTNTIEQMEVKPGGTWRFIMHGPDGRDWPNVIVYEEVVPHERLVYNHGSDDPKDPNHFRVTVTFEEQSGSTKLSMIMQFDTAAERDKVVEEVGAIEGQKQTMDKLEEYLSRDQSN
ncbi:MAG: ATPase [Candidatus Peribacteria bacterium]|nr:ATPase [Candidatus Peribacteria bacterium]